MSTETPHVPAPAAARPAPPRKPPGLIQRFVYWILGMKAALDLPFRPPTAGQCLSLIRFRVFPEKVEVLPKVWAAQRNMLASAAGFISAELLRGPGEGEFMIATRWASVADLERWKVTAREQGGKHMAAMLRGESTMVAPPYDMSRFEVLVSSG